MKPSLPVIAVISPAAEDRAVLADILDGLDGQMVTFTTFREASEVLGRASVVLCDAELPDASWRDVMRCAETASDPPLVIVTARLADNRLWAEVLNEGGHDVLAKPFRSAEVLYSLTSSLLRRDAPALNVQKPGSKDWRFDRCFQRGEKWSTIR
jgi:DNA-binding response OmpR family regulator